MDSFSQKRQLFKEKRKIYICFAIVCLAFFAFISMFGLRILNPRYIDWLMVGGDSQQHYISAEAFRQSRWFFPVGRMNTLNYPSTASVIFTDAIPVMAILYKLFSFALPEPFQYVGIWGLLCFILQGLIAGKLISKYSDNNLVIILGALLFVISPIVVFRMFNHASLGAHWLILISFMPIVYYEEKYSDIRRALILISIIGFLGPAIHMYFLLICGIVIFGFALYDFLNTRKIKRFFLIILVYCLSGIVMTAVLDGFTGSDISAGGLGVFSFNLNSFFNSMGTSIIVPALYSANGQREGYSYLGIGQIMLLLIALIGMIVKYRYILRRHTNMIISLACIAVLCAIFAASNKVTLGERILYNIPLHGFLYRFWATFRATGRVIWPLYYMLILLAVAGCAWSLPPRCTIGILSIVLIFQFYELQPLYSRNQDDCSYASRLQEEKWESLIRDSEFEHLVLIGNEFAQRSLDSIEYELGYLAVKNHMTMNRFWMVHGLYDEYYPEAKKAILEHEKGCLYVFTNAMECVNYPEMSYYELDGYTIGIDENSLTPNIPRAVIDGAYLFDGRYIKNGTDDETGRILHENGISYGPYTHLIEGTYQVVINGTNLQQCEFRLNSNEETAFPEHLIIDKGSFHGNTVTLSFSVSSDISDFEIVISNMEKRDVIIKSINLYNLSEYSSLQYAA